MAIVKEFGNVSLFELLRNTGYWEQNVQEVVDEARDNESCEEGHLVDSGGCEGNSSTSYRGKSVVELLRRLVAVDVLAPAKPTTLMRMPEM